MKQWHKWAIAGFVVGLIIGVILFSLGYLDSIPKLFYFAGFRYILIGLFVIIGITIFSRRKNAKNNNRT